MKRNHSKFFPKNNSIIIDQEISQLSLDSTLIARDELNISQQNNALFQYLVKAIESGNFPALTALFTKIEQQYTRNISKERLIDEVYELSLSTYKTRNYNDVEFELLLKAIPIELTRSIGHCAFNIAATQFHYHYEPLTFRAIAHRNVSIVKYIVEQITANDPNFLFIIENLIWCLRSKMANSNSWTRTDEPVMEEKMEQILDFLLQFTDIPATLPFQM